MKHSFDYFYTMQAMDSFLVEDLSNFTYLFSNDLAFGWFLDVRTQLGETEVRCFGPVDLDSKVMDKSFLYSYKKIEFNEAKIISATEKIVNNEKYMITQVQEISRDEFQDVWKGLVDATC